MDAYCHDPGQGACTELELRGFRISALLNFAQFNVQALEQEEQGGDKQGGKAISRKLPIVTSYEAISEDDSAAGPSTTALQDLDTEEEESDFEL